MKVVTIGRSKEHNDIVVDDVKVSRNHLQMVMDDDGNYSVVDMNSTNGTFVNGRRITGKVPLQVTDELRIGDTVLSWQCYFGSQPNQGFGNPIPPSGPQSTSIPQQPNRNRKPKLWLIFVIIAAAVTLLAVAGGVGWKIYHDRKQKIELEDIRKAEEEVEKQQEALENAQKAALEADKEYEKALRKAAESQSKEDLAKAEEMRKKKEEADRNLKAIEAEVSKLQSDIERLKNESQAAQEQAAAEKKAKETAEERVKTADSAKSAAQKGEQDAKKETQLTEDFYDLLPTLSDKQAAQACDDLNYGVPRGQKVKEVIRNEFKKADNAQKERIINALNRAQKSVAEDKDENAKPAESGQEPAPQPASPETQSDTNNHNE